MAGLPWWQAALAGVFAALGVLWLLRICCRRFGGVSGDVMGACAEVALLTARINELTPRFTGYERGDVDTAGSAGRAAAIAGSRAVHGAGDVRANHDFALDCRYVLYGGFHRILQGFADFKRHLFRCYLISSQQLIRQHAGAGNGGFVTQFFCHHFDVFTFLKYFVAQESVQVLTNLLP